jgi:hypothetical protein
MNRKTLITNLNDIKEGYLYQEDDLIFYVTKKTETEIFFFDTSFDTKASVSVDISDLSPDMSSVYEIGKIENHPEYFL